MLCVIFKDNTVEFGRFKAWESNWSGSTYWTQTQLFRTYAFMGLSTLYNFPCGPKKYGVYTFNHNANLTQLLYKQEEEEEDENSLFNESKH